LAEWHGIGLGTALLTKQTAPLQLSPKIKAGLPIAEGRVAPDQIQSFFVQRLILRSHLPIHTENGEPAGWRERVGKAW